MKSLTKTAETIIHEIVDKSYAPHSIEIRQSSKGVHNWTVKVYGRNPEELERLLGEAIAIAERACERLNGGDK